MSSGEDRLDILFCAGITVSSSVVQVQAKASWRAIAAGYFTAVELAGLDVVDPTKGPSG